MKPEGIRRDYCSILRSDVVNQTESVHLMICSPKCCFCQPLETRLQPMPAAGQLLRCSAQSKTSQLRYQLYTSPNQLTAPDGKMLQAHFFFLQPKLLLLELFLTAYRTQAGLAQKDRQNVCPWVMQDFGAGRLCCVHCTGNADVSAVHTN